MGVELWLVFNGGGIPFVHLKGPSNFFREGGGWRKKRGPTDYNEKHQPQSHHKQSLYTPLPLRPNHITQSHYKRKLAKINRKYKTLLAETLGIRSFRIPKFLEPATKGHPRCKRRTKSAFEGWYSQTKHHPNFQIISMFPLLMS